MTYAYQSNRSAEQTVAKEMDFGFKLDSQLEHDLAFGMNSKNSDDRSTRQGKTHSLVEEVSHLLLCKGRITQDSDSSEDDKVQQELSLPALKKKASGPPESLGINYEPGKYDVICGRGNQCRNHQGNKFFRSVIERSLRNYVKANTKTDKSVVVSRIVREVRRESGDFIRQEDSTGEWFKVSERALREKVGQSLRDALHTQYKSSNKAKKQRKKVEHVQQHEDVTALLGTTNIMDTLITEIKDETPDFQVSNIFNNANIFLLNELKRRMPSPSVSDSIQ